MKNALFYFSFTTFYLFMRPHDDLDYMYSTVSISDS